MPSVNKPLSEPILTSNSGRSSSRTNTLWSIGTVTTTAPDTNDDKVGIMTTRSFRYSHAIKCQDWVEIGSCCRGGHILARSDKIWHVYKVGIINSSQYNATLNNVQYNNAMVPCGSHLTVLCNNVVIESKRRHFDVITSKWRRFDVITTSLFRNVLVTTNDIHIL